MSKSPSHYPGGTFRGLTVLTPDRQLIRAAEGVLREAPDNPTSQWALFQAARKNLGNLDVITEFIIKPHYLGLPDAMLPDTICAIGDAQVPPNSGSCFKILRKVAYSERRRYYHNEHGTRFQRQSRNPLPNGANHTSLRQARNFVKRGQATFEASGTAIRFLKNENRRAEQIRKEMEQHTSGIDKRFYNWSGADRSGTQRRPGEVVS